MLSRDRQSNFYNQIIKAKTSSTKIFAGYFETPFKYG